MHSRPQEIQHVKLLALFREKECWLLILVGVLYFYRPLFMGETFFFRDIYLNIFPQKQLLVDFINARELPLWTPYLSGGRPYLADIPYFSLYPTNILYFFLPGITVFNLNIVLHFIGSAVCAYLFFRTQGFQPVSSVIAALVYGFCGYTLSLANHGYRILVMPYLPLLLLFWHRYMHEGKKKWFTITVIVGALQVFAGGSEMSVVSLLLVLGWTVAYPYPQRSLFRRVSSWILLGVFILGVASVQVFPTTEMILQSSRGEGMTYKMFTDWSLNPRRLPELVLPNFFGYLDTFLIETYYWGSNVLDEQTPFNLSIYIGWVTIILAMTGSAYRNEDRIFPLRIRVFLVVVFAVSLLFSLGKYLPFFQAMYTYIPLIKTFRYPIKFLITGILPLALLTGYACEMHFGNIPVSGSQNQHVSKPIPGAATRAPSGILLSVLWGISALSLFFTVMIHFSNAFSNAFQEIMFKHVGGEVVRQGLESSFGHATAICVLTALLYQYRRLKKRRWQQWVLVCIVITDLLAAGRRLNPYAPVELFTHIPEAVRIVREHLGNGRLFRGDPDLPGRILQAPSKDILWDAHWNLEVLTAYLAASYKIPVIFHKDVNSIGPRSHRALKSLVYTRPWEQKLPFLSAGGVTLVLTPETLSIPGLRHITEIPNRSNLRFHLYQNERAAARIEFVTHWEVAHSDDEALEAMLHSTYDPRKFAILQYPQSTLFERNPGGASIENIPKPNSHECETATLAIQHSTMHSTTYSILNACDGYLVFSETYYPGWHVSVDGQPAPILRANYAFSAIFLKAGDHEVERVYRPNSFLLGAISSCIFCCILFFISYRSRLGRL